MWCKKEGKYLDSIIWQLPWRQGSEVSRSDLLNESWNTDAKSSKW
jgi:hypothetical protein